MCLNLEDIVGRRSLRKEGLILWVFATSDLTNFGSRRRLSNSAILSLRFVIWRFVWGVMSPVRVGGPPGRPWMPTRWRASSGRRGRWGRWPHSGCSPYRLEDPGIEKNIPISNNRHTNNNKDQTMLQWVKTYIDK